MSSHGSRDYILWLQHAVRCFARLCPPGFVDFEVLTVRVMSNHFHPVVETPRADLVEGTKWLLGTYVIRFNRRPKLSGHPFAGCYKSLLIDEATPGYLRTVCDYVHLNRCGPGCPEGGKPCRSTAGVVT